MLRVITAIIKTFKATFTLTQYMKGPRTTTVLNSVFVHTQYLLTVFFVKPGCQTGHTMSNADRPYTGSK